MENNKKKGTKGTGSEWPVRLHVYMARCGIASRRKCEQIIADLRVTVNGETVTKQGTQVNEDDVVMLDGRQISSVKKILYIALHKPPGYISSNSDPDGRPLAIDLLKPVYTQRLYNVGRLDFLSSGLIFFTNDGEFTRAVSHPSSGIEKEYLVETRKAIDAGFLEEYKNGLIIEGERYRLKEYEIKHSRSVRLILEEGKNREIRNVFRSRNIAVKRVHRIRIGCVSLSGILPGHFRALTEKEVRWLFQHSSQDKKA